MAGEIQDEINQKMEESERVGAKVISSIAKWIFKTALRVGVKVISSIAKWIFKKVKKKIDEILDSGKQSLKRLSKKGDQLNKIDLDAESLKDFERIANKKGLAYAVENNGPITSAEQTPAAAEVEKPSIVEALKARSQEQKPKPEQKQEVVTETGITEPAQEAVVRDTNIPVPAQEIPKAEPMLNEVAGNTTLAELKALNEPLSKVEIPEEGISLFNEIMKKHNIPHAVKKPESVEKSAEPVSEPSLPAQAAGPDKQLPEKPLNSYTIFFKAKDTEVMNQIIKEYTRQRMKTQERAETKKTQRDEKPSIVDRVKQRKSENRELNPKDKTKQRSRAREVQIGA